jgi:hypothetical protein
LIKNGFISELKPEANWQCLSWDCKNKAMFEKGFLLKSLSSLNRQK